MTKSFHAQAALVHQRIKELLNKTKGTLSGDDCKEISCFFQEKIFCQEVSAVCRLLGINSHLMLYDNKECHIRPRAKKFLKQLEFSYVTS